MEPTNKNDETRAGIELIARKGMGAEDTFMAIEAKFGTYAARCWLAQRHAAPATWTFPS